MLLDDAGVVGGVADGRRVALEVGEDGGAADGVEQVGPAQLVGDGDRVGGLAVGVEVLDRPRRRGRRPACRSRRPLHVSVAAAMASLLSSMAPRSDSSAWRLCGGTRVPDLVVRRRASSKRRTMACQSVGAMACAERVDGHGLFPGISLWRTGAQLAWFSTGHARRGWGNMRSSVPRGCDSGPRGRAGKLLAMLLGAGCRDRRPGRRRAGAAAAAGRRRRACTTAACGGGGGDGAGDRHTSPGGSCRSRPTPAATASAPTGARRRRASTSPTRRPWRASTSASA